MCENAVPLVLSIITVTTSAGDPSGRARDLRSSAAPAEAERARCGTPDPVEGFSRPIYHFQSLKLRLSAKPLTVEAADMQQGRNLMVDM
jgi:ABC-type transporter lipoprotein component MlaA